MSKARKGLAAICSALWLGLFLYILFNESLQKELLQFCQNHTVLAPFVLVFLQLLFSSFALPCSPFSMIAGLLWGMHLGLLYSVLATMSASIWTFSLGRILNRRRPDIDTKNWIKKITHMIDRFGWKAAFLAHANPLFPSSSLGYFFGMSRLSFSAFVLGAFAGNLPLQFLMVGLGSFTADIMRGF